MQKKLLVALVALTAGSAVQAEVSSTKCFVYGGVGVSAAALAGLAYWKAEKLAEMTGLTAKQLKIAAITLGVFSGSLTGLSAASYFSGKELLVFGKGLTKEQKEIKKALRANAKVAEDALKDLNKGKEAKARLTLPKGVTFESAIEGKFVTVKEGKVDGDLKAGLYAAGKAKLAEGVELAGLTAVVAVEGKEEDAEKALKDAVVYPPVANSLFDKNGKLITTATLEDLETVIIKDDEQGLFVVKV